MSEIDKLDEQIKALSEERAKLRLTAYHRKFRETVAPLMVECLTAMCDDEAFHRRVESLRRVMRDLEARDDPTSSQMRNLRAMANTYGGQNQINSGQGIMDLGRQMANTGLCGLIG